MPWVYSVERYGPVVRYEGPLPEYLYHYTTREALRAIITSRVIRPSAGGGLQVSGLYGDVVSFTDRQRSPNWALLKYAIRIRTKDVPGARPVTYAERKWEVNSKTGGAMMGTGYFVGKPAPLAELRPIGFAEEEEWFTDQPVPLRRGKFSHTPVNWYRETELA